MKKENFVNKASVEKLYRTACLYCARKDLEKLKNAIQQYDVEIDKATDPNGWGLLMIASYLDHTMVVDYLISLGANLNKRENTGSTALLGAISNNSTMSTHKLLTAGADANLANKNGFTPLMSACHNGNVEIVERLLGCTHNIMATDVCNKTALDYALAQDNYHVINFIERSVIHMKIPLNSKKAQTHKI